MLPNKLPGEGQGPPRAAARLWTGLCTGLWTGPLREAWSPCSRPSGRRLSLALPAASAASGTRQGSEDAQEGWVRECGGPG